VGRFAGVFVTSLLIFIIASIFLPFLIPLFGNDYLISNGTIAEPLNLLLSFLSDPSLSWIKVLLVIPLVMIWFIVS